MSIIYDSLQKLKKSRISDQIPEQMQGKENTARLWGPFLRAGLYVTVFMALLLGLVMGTGYFVQKRLSESSTASSTNEKQISSQELTDKLEQAAKTDEKSGSTQQPESQKQPILGKHIQEMETRVQKMVVSNNFPKNSYQSSHKEKQGSKRPESTLEKGRELNQGLRSRFSSRAKQNQHILELQRQLQSLLQSSQLKEAAGVLQQMQEILSEDNSLIPKWKGVLALKRKKYQRAEKLFSEIWESDTQDLNSGVNLVLALLGQEKFKPAKQIYESLQKEFPQDPMLDKIDFLANI